MTLPFDPIEEAARNWETRGWGAIDAMRVATAVTRVHQVLHARIEKALAPLGLNFSRFEVLALLSFTRNQQLPMGKIGDRLQVHPASVTNTVHRLESDRLVTRVPHPDDGRTTLARLLPAGRTKAEQGAETLALIGYGLEGLRVESFGDCYEALADYRHQNGDFDTRDAPGSE